MPFLSPAQTTVADSLKSVLNDQAEDSGKVKTLNRLAWLLRTSDPAKAMSYAEQSLALATKTGFDKGRGDAYNTIGVIHYRRGEYIEATKVHLMALTIREQIGDKEGMVLSYINLGNVYADQNQDSLALEQYKNAEKIIEGQDDQSRLATVCLDIGAIYVTEKRYTEAFTYLEKAKARAIADEDKSIEALTLNNLGVAYEGTGRYDAAMDVYRQAYSIHESLGDKTSMVDAAINIGSVYRERKDYTEALDWHFRAEKMGREIGYLEGIRVLYENLSKDYEAMSEFEKALRYHIRFKEVSDSLFNDENTTQISELTNRWKNEHRERVLAEKEKELANRIESEHRTKQRMLFVVAVAAALLVFASYAVYANRKNQRANTFLAAQKQQIERKSEAFARAGRELAAGRVFLQQARQSLKPSAEKFSRLLPGAFLLHQPKEMLSGDFFAVEPDEGRVLLLSGRCAGEEIPAAMQSTMILHAFRQAIRTGNAGDPAKLAELLQPVFSAGTGEAAAFILLLLDRNRGLATFIANGNPLLLLRENLLEEYVTPPFSAQTIAIQPGDILYLSSDRLRPQLKSLVETTGNLPMNEQKLRIASLAREMPDTLSGDLLLAGIRI